MENKRLKQDNECFEIIQSMGKLHEALKQRHFRIDKFIENPGFHHIALEIFKNLDPKSLGNCRQVSKDWMELIDTDSSKFWWKFQLDKCEDIEF